MAGPLKKELFAASLILSFAGKRSMVPNISSDFFNVPDNGTYIRWWLGRKVDLLKAFAYIDSSFECFQNDLIYFTQAQGILSYHL